MAPTRFILRTRSYAAALLAFLLISWPMGAVASPPMSEVIVPGDVATLVTALKNSPDLIYQYVHDHIRTVPVYGYQRGPVGTILDGEGSDLDQAVLMQQLLIAAGYADASLVIGQITLNAAQLSAWLGTDSAIATAQTLLTNGGIPVTSNGSTLTIAHAWVKVTIGGTNYVFDPSYKASTFTQPINIAGALGSYQGTPYSPAAIAAGSSVSSPTVRAQLQQYAINLENYIKTNYPNGAKVEDVIGGQTITPLPMPLVPLRQTSLAYQTGMPTVSTTVPSNLATIVNFTMPGVNQTFTSDQLYAQDIYINNTGRSPTLVVGANSYTSTATESVAITMSLTYPFLSSTQTQTGTVTYTPVGLYQLVMGMGHMGRGQIERMRKRTTVPSGHSSLTLQSYSWLAQTMLATQINDQLSGTVTVSHGILGIYGYLYVGGNAGFADPYFDIPIQQMTTSGLTSNAGYSANASLLNTFGIAHAATRGAMQQTRDVDAVSVMSIAEGGAGLQQVTTLPNTAQYSAVDQTMVTNFVAAGGRAFLSPYATATPGSSLYYNIRASGWTGYGFILVARNGTASYYLAGQNPTQYGFSFVTGTHQGAQVDASGTWALDEDRWGLVSGLDPRANGGTSDGAAVDIATGSANYSSTESSFGTAFPLTLKVNYNSDSMFSLTPGMKTSPLLGPDWTSNLEISAHYGDDPLHGMGHEAAALDASAAIAGLFVSQDLLKQDQTLTSGGTVSATGNYFIAASYAQSWLLDQLRDNTVTVMAGRQMSQFGKLPDGSYNPPPGSSSQLTVASDGSLTVRDKFGTVMQFQAVPNQPWAPFQQVCTITDRVGNVTKFSYNAGYCYQGTLAAISTNAGSVGIGGCPNGYYPGRMVIAGSNPFHCTAFIIDGPSGRWPGMLTGIGRWNGATNFSYDSNNRLISIFGADNVNAPLFTNVFDALGRVKQRVSGRGNTTNYYIAGSRSEVVDPLGNSTIVYFDDYGRPVRTVDALGNATVTSYDALNRVVSKTAPEGNIVSYQYDARSNVTRTILTPKSGSGLNPVTASATYDPTWNLPLTKTDALGRTTTSAYDATTGNLLRVTAPTVTVQGGGTQTLVTQYTSYNSFGEVLSMTGPDGMVTSATYDSKTGENLSQTVDAGAAPHLNLLTSKTYDMAGNAATAIDANGNKRGYWYDDRRQMTGYAVPTSPNFIQYADYTLDGYQGCLYGADGTKTYFTRDVDGNVTNKQLSSTSGSRNYAYTYDIDDRLSTSTDPALNVTTQAYDAAGRVYQVINAKGKVAVQYAYTPNGKIASIADGNGNAISYTYDGLDRVIKTTWPDASYAADTYDAAGNVLTHRNRYGEVTAFTYDELNRKVTETPPSGSGDSMKSYTYDFAGRIKTVSDANGVFTYGYDTAGRMISVQRPDGKTIQYAYDANGNRTQLTWPDSYYVSYTYDQFDRVTVLKENSTTTLATYDYTSTYQRLTLGFANGRSSVYGYDTLNDVTSLTINFPNSGYPIPTLAYNYTYANTGQRASTSVALTNLVNTNGFIWNPTVSSTTTYTANNLNQYSSVVNTVSGTTNLTYDARGNLTGDGTNSLSWDYKNRLTGTTNSLHSAAYAYDLFGRRSSKIVDGLTTKYLDDGIQEIAEYDGSGNLLRRYVYGPNPNEPLVMITASSGAKLYHHADARGSIVATTDGSGNLVDSRAYGPYGEGTPSSGTPFGFTGQRFDSETGLYYYHARYYHPALGRFLSPDPKHKRKKGDGSDGDGEQGSGDGKDADPHAGDSTYAYAGNDPINNVDPSGEVYIRVDGGFLTVPCGYATFCLGNFDVGMDGGSSNNNFQWLLDYSIADSMRVFQNQLNQIMQSANKFNVCMAGLQTANKDSNAVQRARNSWSTLTQAASTHGIDASLLAAVGVRESGFQNVMEHDGAGVGVGIFQITVSPSSGVTIAQAQDLNFSANYAANMLSSNMSILSGRYPNFNQGQLLQATAASYNLGIDPVKGITGNPNTIDVGTPGGNYGSNVMQLMNCF